MLRCIHEQTARQLKAARETAEQLSQLAVNSNSLEAIGGLLLNQLFHYQIIYGYSIVYRWETIITLKKCRIHASVILYFLVTRLDSSINCRKDGWEYDVMCATCGIYFPS